jgi:hypothetical protein
MPIAMFAVVVAAGSGLFWPLAAYVLVSGLRRIGLISHRTGGGAGLHHPYEGAEDRRADPGDGM